MIIQIRGTSGTGKTWVMKQVMDELEYEETMEWIPVMTEGRKKPLKYVAENRHGYTVCVLGHYESPCGGCDTIGSARQIFELIRTLTEDIIICEGLLLSEDSKWTSAEGFFGTKVKIAYLSTPIEKCISQIKDRRKLVGNTKLIKEDNTRNRVRVIERSRIKLKDLDHVTARRCSSKQAVRIIKGWINAE